MLNFNNIAVEMRRKYVLYMFLLRKTIGLRQVQCEPPAKIKSSNVQRETVIGRKKVEVLLCRT